MVSHWFTKRAARCAVATAALLGSAVSAEDGPQVIRVEAAPQADSVTAQEVAIEGNVIVASSPLDAGERVLQGRYWIGASCEPAGAALKAQLKLEGGLVVEGVQAESPAARAGIQENDILLQLGEDKLTGVGQLVELIDNRGAKPVDVIVLRAGERKTISLSPAERPKDVLRDAADVEREIKTRLRHLEDEHHRALTLSIVRPGVVVPPGHMKTVELPSGMSIHIQKEGDKPAKIEVKRGDKNWSVTEDKLDELPADVRPFVDQMRGQTIHFRLPQGVEAERKAIRVMSVPADHAGAPGPRFTVKALPPGGMPGKTPSIHATPAVPLTAPVGIPFDMHHKQLAEMHAKLDRVLKAVQEPGEVEALQKEVGRLRDEVKELRKQIEK